MRKIAIVALKGGVGKSSVVAGLGQDLVSKAYKVGLLDIDVTGSNLYSALGLAHSPKWQLDSVNEKIIVPKIADRCWLLSISSHTGEDYAVLWESSQHKELESIKDRLLKVKDLSELQAISREIDDILASGKWHFIKELLSDDIVTWPEPLDFLITDCPPSTSNELFSFLDEVKDLFGVVIVSQPTKISTTGLIRTIDLLRVKQIPIIGLVANLDGFLNRHGEVEYQFLSPRVDLEKIAKQVGIPFLVSIPQTGDWGRAKPYFSQLADKVIASRPVVLKEITLERRLKRRLVKGIARLGK